MSAINGSALFSQQSNSVVLINNTTFEKTIDSKGSFLYFDTSDYLISNSNFTAGNDELSQNVFSGIEVI